MKVKICGIKSEIDLATALKEGADAVGFITDVPVETPRKITLRVSSELISKVPVFVTSVLVIMPENAEIALDMISMAKPDAVQIHNDMDLSDLRTIKSSGTKLIKTIPVPENVDKNSLLDRVAELEGIADAILLDTAIAGKAGGTGITHNWELSSEIVDNCSIPVILAGGLNPLNVAEAARLVRPYAVDTASGVETGGKKDEKKVHDFIAGARMNDI